MSFQLRREEVLDAAGLAAMLEESPARAAQAILLAAGEGEVEAQALLGQILLDGQGIAQDQPLALRWFGIAAGRGHLMARNMLGRCQEHGWGARRMPRSRRSIIESLPRPVWIGRCTTWPICWPPGAG